MDERDGMDEREGYIPVSWTRRGERGGTHFRKWVKCTRFMGSFGPCSPAAAFPGPKRLF